jgi:hypothetical protein
MLNMKLSNALIAPASGADNSRLIPIFDLRRLDVAKCVNPAMFRALSARARNQTAKRPVGVMTRPRFAEKKI